MRLYHGDCVKVMNTFEPNSIDAIVTDPPYGLKFMGKEFDNLGEGMAQQLWHLEWAKAAFRVLKPGGHMLVFGGTRTYHRMACAVEDAGFEIRDQVQWLYGCLSADTEILTETGWRPGIEVEVGEQVAQWDHATGAISLGVVEQTYRAPWDGPMRLFRNADTDQLLTPNHRVYHQIKRRQQIDGVRSSMYGDGWEVAEARDLSRVPPTRFPIAGEHDGPGVGGDDYAALLGWVWTEGGFDLSGTGVRIYQSSVNADKVAEIASLMDRMGSHKRYDRERTYQDRQYVETTWFFSGELANRVRADLPGKRPTYPLLWKMTNSEKRALLNAALLGDGSYQKRGRAWQFYQQYEDDLVWFQTLLALTGQAGKMGMRSNRPGGAVYLRNRATTELQWRHYDESWEHYQGEVWCVRVPTGAFVARRNGKVFITGNSGFPKSMDLGKAIDKSLGKERTEVSGVKPGHEDFVTRTDSHAAGGRSDGWDRPWREDPDAVARSHMTYAPASEEAAHWEGWGTALKPANEPIVLARKPFLVSAVNVVGTVESSLREQGVTGKIRWSNESVSDVVSSGQLTSSFSTDPLATEGTSVAPAVVSEMQSDVLLTDSDSVTSIEHGERPTASTFVPTLDNGTPDFEMKSSTRMEARAPVAENLSGPSSPSITSKVVGPSTDVPSTARSTPNYDVRDFPPGTEFFAGTATGLSGSLAHVLIRKRPDGTFVWPEGLPKKVSAKPTTVAKNVLEHGVGAINIDATRIGYKSEDDKASATPQGRVTSKEIAAIGAEPDAGREMVRIEFERPEQQGRFPANVILTHDDDCKIVGMQEDTFGGGAKATSGFVEGYDRGDGFDGRTIEVAVWECVDGCPVKMLDEQSGTSKSRGHFPGARGKGGLSTSGHGGQEGIAESYMDIGGASRFFYCSKASGKERHAGLEGKSDHPTMKPIALMRYLVRLITPKGGVVLDPFLGSGTTLIAAHQEDFEGIGIEKDEHYLTDLAAQRIAHWGADVAIESPVLEPAEPEDPAQMVMVEPEPEPVQEVVEVVDPVPALMALD